MECEGTFTLKQICRIQELVKLLHINTFRFMFCIKWSNGDYYARYKITDMDEYKKLNMFLYDSDIKPWSKWQRFIFKIKRLFRGKIK